MTKKAQEKKADKGQRITGRKASAERYIPLFEFLLFDPTYREMKEKAKILYCFLRKKSLDFEQKTEAYETAIANGEDLTGTKSYRDENDEIYCIADNAELSIILQCHYNRVPDFKKELHKYGLLEETPQKDRPNRLYILEPTELAERWSYINEMIELRTKIKEENKAKFEKRLAAKKAKKEEVATKTKGSDGNSQNVGYGNSQNVSKYQSKGFKSTLKNFKSTFNLSISDDIQNSALPIPFKKVLDKRIDRLIEFDINISDIELHHNAVKEVYPENEYAFVLDNLITKMQFKPNSFASVMDDWLKRNRVNLLKLIMQTKANNESVRKEKLPDWFVELNDSEQQRYWNKEAKPLFRQKQEDDKNKKVTDEEMKQAKQEIEEMLKKLRA